MNKEELTLTPYEEFDEEEPVEAEGEEEEDFGKIGFDIQKNPLIFPITMYAMNWKKSEETLLLMAAELNGLYSQLNEKADEFWIKDNPDIALYKRMVEIQEKMLAENRKTLLLSAKSYNALLKMIDESNIGLDIKKYMVKKMTIPEIKSVGEAKMVVKKDEILKEERKEVKERVKERKIDMTTCRKCKRRIKIKNLEVVKYKNNRYGVRGFCPYCNCKISRFIGGVSNDIKVSTWVKKLE